MKKILGGALALCLLLTMMATGQAALNKKEVESRARALLEERLGCPAAMEQTGVYETASYSAVYMTADARVANDFLDMRAAYSVSFSYWTEEGYHAYASAFFDKATDAPVSLSILHDSVTPQYAEGPYAKTAFSDVLMQDMVDAAVRGVEERLGLSDLVWHTEWDRKAWINWGPCIRARALISEDFVLTVCVGCDDGLAHGLELQFGTLTDTLPVYDRDDG